MEEWCLLSCEPPKILDENNECVSEISSEKWREVVENSAEPWMKFIHLDNFDKRRYGKVLIKYRVDLSEEIHFSLAAIGKTADGEYKMLGLWTCYQEVAHWYYYVDSLNEGGDLDLFSMVKILMPQVVSIIFFLLLLIFYLTIGELRKTVYGQCWINFLINSLINYSAAILQFIYFKNEQHDDSFNSDGTVENLTFQVSSTIIIFTEFSLYFWLNITFFEAFYTMR
jgi:hypothetical protein